MHAEFYPTLDQAIVEDCFRQAIQKYGTPEATYFDNGWLSECYQNKPHAALSTDTHSISPETALRSDRKALRFLEPEVLANAFLHAETRQVDKSGCISFMDRKYEVGLSFIGCTVDVIYDPADFSQVTIEYQGYEPWQARPLVIGERAGYRPKLPEHLGVKPADKSRVLDAAEKQHEQCKDQQARAISYTSAWNEVKKDV